MDFTTQRMLDELRYANRRSSLRNTTQTRAAREAETAMRSQAANFWADQIGDRMAGQRGQSRLLDPYSREGRLMHEADSAMRSGLQRLRSPHLTRAQRFDIVSQASPMQRLRQSAAQSVAQHDAEQRAQQYAARSQNPSQWMDDYRNRLGVARALGMNAAPTQYQMRDPGYLSELMGRREAQSNRIIPAPQQPITQSAINDDMDDEV